MHESGIATRVLEVALERARSAGASRITDVHLELGDESGVAADALALYWPLVSRSTAASDASLHVTAAADPFACRVVAIDVADEA